jgi:uncharacterized protein
MPPFEPAPKPLTRAELHRLGTFLESCDDDAMNLEELDGFFAALIAGPEVVMLSEYLPEVLGGELSEVAEFDSIEQANEMLNLLNRHWNTIAAALYKNDVYVPLLLKDEDGAVHGNDWAQGFLRGTYMRHNQWSELVDDDEYGGFMVPVMMLYHEHDEDPALRPEPITQERREKAIAGMAAGVLGAYQYFRERPRAQMDSVPVPERRPDRAKVGRNEPCPCGSGKKYKKYKKCCGGATVN